ncbi:MAG: tetratricopeptide repeat protein [Chitinophagaceae bacterium]
MNKLLPLLTAALLGGFLFSCKNKAEKADTDNTKEIVYTDELKEWMRLLETNPDSNGLRFKIATTLDSIRDYKAALSQMDSLIKRDSANYAFAFTKGKIYQDAGDTTNAIAYYQKALKIYPAPEGMLFLANLLAETKNPESLNIVQQVKSLRLGSSDNANCDFIAGVYYARVDDTTKAIRSLDLALNQDYTLMPAYIEKGLVYFDRKNYPRALDIFRFASQVNHLYADAYYYMARSYEMMGQKDSAILRFQQAYSLDNSMEEATAGLKRLGASSK